MEKMVNAEFFDALEQLEKEKGIPVDYMLDRVGQALITAYKRDNDGMTDNVYVEPNREEKTIRMYVRKTVVRTEDLYEPYEEITLEEAADYKVNPQVGDIIDIDIPTKSFGRIAAQTAKQVIIQGIREAERGMVISEFESKEHEILNATVARIDPRSGSAYLDVVSGGEKSEAILAASEQVRGETLVEGQHVKVYLIEVRRGTRGVQVIVSRTHPGLVKRLFELEVPEIHSGVVEVKSIAREAGNRTKIAVTSHDENVDPIGACVGTRGARVSNITAELNGEKIDIIKWNEDMATFVSAALAPADVISASMQADGKSCRVIVPDDQLSLAIGKEGQNARLAAKLTGCKIDIEDDGSIFIASEDIEACRAARKTIENIVFEPEVGELYYGKVSNIRSDFGAWVELAPGKDGLVKIKDLEFKRTEKVEDVLKIGDMTWVKVMNVDDRGRIDLSRKDAMREKGLM